MNLSDPNYSPGPFIDWVRKVTRQKSDARLARYFCMSQALLSRIRAGTAPVSHKMMIAIHEESGLGTLEIKCRMFVKQK